MFSSASSSLPCRSSRSGFSRTASTTTATGTRARPTSTSPSSTTHPSLLPSTLSSSSTLRPGIPQRVSQTFLYFLYMQTIAAKNWPKIKIFVFISLFLDSGSILVILFEFFLLVSNSYFQFQKFAGNSFSHSTQSWSSSPSNRSSSYRSGKVFKMIHSSVFCWD